MKIDSPIKPNRNYWNCSFTEEVYDDSRLLPCFLVCAVRSLVQPGGILLSGQYPFGRSVTVIDNKTKLIDK